MNVYFVLHMLSRKYPTLLKEVIDFVIYTGEFIFGYDNPEWPQTEEMVVEEFEEYLKNPQY